MPESGPLLHALSKDMLALEQDIEHSNIYIFEEEIKKLIESAFDRLNEKVSYIIFIDTSTEQLRELIRTMF